MAGSGGQHPLAGAPGERRVRLGRGEPGTQRQRRLQRRLKLYRVRRMRGKARLNTRPFIEKGEASCQHLVEPLRLPAAPPHTHATHLHGCQTRLCL